MSVGVPPLAMEVLMDAWADKRLRCSSSHSIFRPPTASLLDHGVLRISSAAVFTCLLSLTTAALVVGGSKRSAIVVKGSCFGEEGAWLQVSSAPDFWLEVYAPTFTAREIHLRAQTNKASR